MEIRSPACRIVVIQDDPVNWPPWSVFMISGALDLATASFKASTQKHVLVAIRAVVDMARRHARAVEIRQDFSVVLERPACRAWNQVAAVVK
ncbi:MAG: hypothetical protein AAF667_16215 [Pseudomonadota bacterium]